MNNEREARKKGVWPWTVALLAASPLLYVASFGPACWWFWDEGDFAWPRTGDIASAGGTIEFNYAPRVYWPIGWVALHGPDSCQRAIQWYATVAIDSIELPTAYDGPSWIRLSRHN